MLLEQAGRRVCDQKSVIAKVWRGRAESRLCWGGLGVRRAWSCESGTFRFSPLASPHCSAGDGDWAVADLQRPCFPWVARGHEPRAAAQEQVRPLDVDSAEGLAAQPSQRTSFLVLPFSVLSEACKFVRMRDCLKLAGAVVVHEERAGRQGSSLAIA